MTREWPLVGRSEELEVIARATRAAGDRARGIVLSGVAGVGKTRLAREAIAISGPHDLRRHWIVGTASARRVPLGAFVDIATSFGPDPLRRVREVIDALLGDRSRTVVVGVDDAHHLDELSAFAVHQLVTRRLATVILTIRAGERPPDAITAIWKDQLLERLELQPFSLDETARLVEHVLDGPLHSLSAQRLWRYTQGNVLYLHHLIDSELTAGRITRHSGVWLWLGHLELSPTLAELLEARIALAPTPVRGVLDALAVAEPLDTDILATITDADAVAEAEALGLVRIDADVQPMRARLAHPMLGEVRCTGSLHLRRLRGRIATELARKPETDPRKLVQRAVLTMDSDLPPDPQLLTSATSAAMQLHDAGLAETLAERAVEAGGGLDTRIAHAVALASQDRGAAAETVLAQVADRVSGSPRFYIAVVRATNLAVNLGQLTRAERILDEATPANDATARRIGLALRAWTDVARGHANTVVDRARNLCSDPPADTLAHMLSIGALVTALGDLGIIDEIDSAADSGIRLAEQAPELSHLRIALAFMEANAFRFAGALTSSDATITRIQLDTRDAPYERSWHAFLSGMSAMSRGALVDAQRSLQECAAYLGSSSGSGRMMKAVGRSWLATVMAIAGRAAEARQEVDSIDWLERDADNRLFDPQLVVAQAWVYAAEGAVSQAISLVRDAALTESELGRPGRETLLLQTATQFGDPTTAPRLAELAGVVQGPRAPAAAAHAAALARGSGDGLVEASRRYQEFGDRVAAADAAAHAVLAYQNAGLRGSALTASATAQRLADECQGADTTALRAAAMPLPITARQREIIALAAQGLSNKQIADRLTMSVRSVQGHLFRAAQRVGVHSRDDLIAMLEGS